LRAVLLTLLEHHANGPFAHLGGVSACLLHGSIVSRAGASAIHGAIHHCLIRPT
jgi:hypothetical protein